MKTVALRFSNQFAPVGGTIKAHKALINKYGFVWYGKLGLPLSQKAVNYVMSNSTPKLLLIHSGTSARYWAYVSEVKRECPNIEYIPTYYRNDTDKFKTWFKVTRFESAPKDIMGRSYVISSGAVLGQVSKRSMSPYFMIEVQGEE